MYAMVQKQNYWDLTEGNTHRLKVGWRAVCFNHPRDEDDFVPSWQSDLYPEDGRTPSHYFAVLEARLHDKKEHSHA